MRIKQPYTDRTIPSNAGQSRDIDGMLEGFFKAEVPHPWPACPTLRDVTVQSETPSSSHWFAESKKLAAIALGIGAILLTYSFLAGNFPDAGMGPSDLQNKGTIGNKPDTPAFDPGNPTPEDGGDAGKGRNNPTTIPTKNGGVRLWEHRQDNKIFMRLEALPKP